MQMDAIKLFCAVADHRSISRAASESGVTQSAASQRLQALEKELGVRLVDRSKRPLELTAAGELFYSGCKKIRDQYEQLKRQVTGAANPTEDPEELRGQVEVAAIYSAGIDLLNQLKASFEAEHPGATVRIRYAQPETVYERVHHEQADLGILSYPQRWPALASVPLRDETMVLVMRPDHVLASAGSVRAPQLAEHDMVSFDEALPIGRRIRRYLHQHGAGANIVNQFDNIDTIKTFVAETESLAILPARTVQREVAAGVLATAELAPPMVRPVGIVYLRQREQGALVRAFAEYLIDHQPSGGPSEEGSAAVSA